MEPVKTLSKGQRLKKVILVVILMDLLALPGCSYKSMQKFTLKTDHLVNVVKKPPEVA